MQQNQMFSIIVLVLHFIAVSASGQTWSSAPEPTGVGSSSFDQDGTRYVAPGQKISILVKAMDHDTSSDCTNQLPDEEAIGLVHKVGGTVAGEWQAPVAGFAAASYVTYTVPEAATEGQDIWLAFEVGDDRESNDPRHDEMKEVKAWYFKVRLAAPTLSVHSVTNTTPPLNNIPANSTRGSATVVMILGGDLPPGTLNWHGTVFTERLGSFEGTAGDFAAGINLVGSHPNLGDNASFTSAGGAVNSTFEDKLSISRDVIVLAEGVNTTTLTHAHDYVYGENEYPFGGTTVFTRQANKVTVARSISAP